MGKRVAKTISIMQLLAMFNTEDKAVSMARKSTLGRRANLPPLQKPRQYQRPQKQEVHLLV